MRGAGNWAGARNLLCIRLDALGDVLMTEPAIRALRGSLARSRITLLTSTSGAEACGMIAAIDDVIAYDPPWMRSGSGQRRREDRGMIDRLARHRFDGAVIFTVYSQSALPAAYLTHLAGIPRSLAYGRENPYHLLTDHRAEDEPHRIVRHEVRRHLDLVASIGCSTPDERIHVRPSPRARRSIRERIGAMGLRRDEPWVVVHAGATAPSRRYPVERFAEVVARLRRDLRWPVVLTGSETE
ncbi:MAG TPA: glycosyltransferase family 9 protein, partial [Actinomycetota bacterium]|nr:glycosyltransferase family 9 protein [Actinomycetota bacterium]